MMIDQRQSMTTQDKMLNLEKKTYVRTCYQTSKSSFNDYAIALVGSYGDGCSNKLFSNYYSIRGKRLVTSHKRVFQKKSFTSNFPYVTNIKTETFLPI